MLVKNKQPILIGTTSIEESEEVSNLLAKNNIPHQVLNAKQHEREADIIAQAGTPGSVTIATNMAGRGTDIVLGGNKDKLFQGRFKEGMSTQEINIINSDVERDFSVNQNLVLKAGGLMVIGMGRNESRRVDNQLRGRAGRQGDPGVSKFFLSLDDELLKIFLPENTRARFQKLDDSEDGDISNGLLNKAIVGAQKRMEGRNFDIRKQLLRYDDVMNSQRKEIYGKRSEIMNIENITEEIGELFMETINELVDRSFVNDKWNTVLLEEELVRIFAINMDIASIIKDSDISTSKIVENIEDAVFTAYQNKRDKWGKDIANRIEKIVYLQTIDQLWKEHLLAMDHLRQGIHLRAYGQRDPLNEYKSEAFNIFAGLIKRIRETLTHGLMVLNYDIDAAAIDDYEDDGEEQGYYNTGESDYGNTVGKAGKLITGRNDPCSCGSNKKFKHCCGRR